jgi:hypothetical protein
MMLFGRSWRLSAEQGGWNTPGTAVRSMAIGREVAWTAYRWAIVWMRFTRRSIL